MSDLPPIQRGMTVGFYARRGVYASDWAFEQIPKLTALNIDHVVLVVTVMQESFGSTRQFQDFEVTPSDLELLRYIEALHAAGINVQLRPMQQTWDGSGRLEVWTPDDRVMIPGLGRTMRGAWFDSFAQRTAHYAALAQEAGCAMFCLDSELDRMVDQQDGWRRVLDAARTHFHGHITNCHTFAADWDKQLADKHHWWYELDSLSCSFYMGIGADDEPTVPGIVAALQPRKDWIARLAATYGKPLYFGEAGCTSCSGASQRPSSWAGDGRYAPEEQANWLEALCQLFWDEPWWRGLYWWKWDEQNVREQFRNDPAGDKGFTIDGKPAAEVMRKWYGRDDRRGRL